MGKKSRRSRPSKKERKVNNDAMKAKTKLNSRASISTSKCKRMERITTDGEVRVSMVHASGGNTLVPRRGGVHPDVAHMRGWRME